MNEISKIKGFINLNVKRFSNNVQTDMNIDDKNKSDNKFKEDNHNHNHKSNPYVSDFENNKKLKDNSEDNDYLNDIIRIYYDIEVSEILILVLWPFKKYSW